MKTLPRLNQLGFFVGTCTVFFCFSFCSGLFTDFSVSEQQCTVYTFATESLCKLCRISVDVIEHQSKASILFSSSVGVLSVHLMLEKI